MATLNGWQQLWLVFTCPWVVFWVVVSIGIAVNALGNTPPENIFTVIVAVLAMTVVPPTLLYAAGLGVAWVRRGFRG